MCECVCALHCPETGRGARGVHESKNLKPLHSFNNIHRNHTFKEFLQLSANIVHLYHSNIDITGYVEDLCAGSINVRESETASVCVRACVRACVCVCARVRLSLTATSGWRR